VVERHGSRRDDGVGVLVTMVLTVLVVIVVAVPMMLIRSGTGLL
jgi:hypothetical protein